MKTSGAGEEPAPSPEIFQEHKRAVSGHGMIVSKTTACNYHSGQTVNVFSRPRAACSSRASKRLVIGN